MILLQAFLNSVKLPNKQAILKLNRIGMDITVLYMSILVLLVSIPSLAERLTATDGASADMQLILLLVYFFIFYYLPLITMVFLLLSLVAYIGTGISRLLKRKIKFPILWKMSAYTTTIPFLLYTVIALILKVDVMYLWLFLISSLFFITKIITVYPKRKFRK